MQVISSAATNSNRIYYSKCYNKRTSNLERKIKHIERSAFRSKNDTIYFNNLTLLYYLIELNIIF